MNRSLLKFTIFCALLAAVTCGCAHSTEWDRKVGAEASKDLEANDGLYVDPKLTANLNDTGQKIVNQVSNRQYGFQFHIIDQPVANAFSLPGGYVYVTRGFLEGTWPNSESFVGTVNIDVLRWALAHQYPEYELALAAAMTVAIPGNPAERYPGQMLFRNDRGALEANIARNLTKNYVDLLQRGAALPHGNWIQIEAKPSPVWERADWTNGYSIRQLLGDRLERASIPRLAQMRNQDAVGEVLTRSGEFVAGLDGDKFADLIDRNALLNELGKRAALAAYD